MLKNNFPYTVFTIATNDEDKSVKVAALRCLQQMVEVDDIRRNIISIPYVYVRLTFLST